LPTEDIATVSARLVVTLARLASEFKADFPFDLFALVVTSGASGAIGTVEEIHFHSG
jgi:diadenosine tetraphosphate (Ap4A) HIT family hydrolase